jgi:hypothetical protein
MWLITTLIAAILVSAIYLTSRPFRKHKPSFLALMLWGTFIMILADHIIAYLRDGGEFLSMTTDGLIENSILLGIAMLIPILLIWAIVAFTPLGNKIRV